MSDEIRIWTGTYSEYIMKESIYIHWYWVLIKKDASMKSGSVVSGVE